VLSSFLCLVLLVQAGVALAVCTSSMGKTRFAAPIRVLCPAAALTAGSCSNAGSKRLGHAGCSDCSVHLCHKQPSTLQLNVVLHSCAELVFIHLSLLNAAMRLHDDVLTCHPIVRMRFGVLVVFTRVARWRCCAQSAPASVINRL